MRKGLQRRKGVAVDLCLFQEKKRGGVCFERGKIIAGMMPVCRPDRLGGPDIVADYRYFKRIYAFSCSYPVEYSPISSDNLDYGNVRMLRTCRCTAAQKCIQRTPPEKDPFEM